MRISKISIYTFLTKNEYKDLSSKFREIRNPFKKTVISNMNKEYQSVLDEAICFSEKNILHKIRILP